MVYDDEAIENLLDRTTTQEGTETVQQKEFGMNEYLSSFKVASYLVKEGLEEVSLPFTLVTITPMCEYAWHMQEQRL